MKADPNNSASVITAEQEWDITALLPQVSANMGIEAVEWVANEDVDGLLYDENTKAVFDHNKYPDAVSGGVFFVALEDNGHVYAFVLNNDSTAVLIADIDSKLGGAMALDYDTYEDVLWVASDNGYNNRIAKISLTGSSAPAIEHYTPASGLDTTLNYEGFAIAAAEYTVDGQRPVYRFQDGVTEGALAIGYMACDYKEDIQDVPGEVVPPNTDDSDSGSGMAIPTPTQKIPGLAMKIPTTYQNQRSRHIRQLETCFICFNHDNCRCCCNTGIPYKT